MKEKMDHLRSMKLHGLFCWRYRQSKIGKIMALALKFETGNKKLVVSSTGANL